MKPKIAICVPAHDHVPMLFAYDLANLVGFSTAALDGDVEIGLNVVTATYAHTARNQLAEHVLSVGATHVLWIDADMRFPRDALLRLLRHNVAMVGINYSTRGVPPKFVAIKRIGLEPGVKSERLVTAPDSTGIEDVEAIGFGLVLMKARVLADVWNSGPAFGHEYMPETGQWVGEDVWFCRRARASGHRILVDHDLSRECAHVGTFEYRPEHACAVMEEAAR